MTKLLMEGSTCPMKLTRTGDRLWMRGGSNMDILVYIPTPEDLHFRGTYEYWVHTNKGGHLSWGITDDAIWQAQWCYLAVITARPYNTPEGKVGRRFMWYLSAKLQGL